MVTSKSSHDVVKESKSFFNFLLDSHASEEQKYFLLENPSKTHLKAIIEIFHNLLQNLHLKLSYSLKRSIKKNKQLLLKLISETHKNLVSKRQLLRKKSKIIYQILLNAKDIIHLAINQ